ncbi:MAG: MFS transporter [Leptospiraceae bacterium]|nr:MFS transporter [Leptospiraceae bacterium]
MMIPELPSYLTRLGGESYKGLIISLFTLMAGLSRPISGKLSDTIGRIPVMIFGASICFIAGFFYPLVTTVTGFLILRFIHGMATGFKPTGTSAYVADIVPASKRGEAMGIMGVALSFGMTVGPSIGSLITSVYSLDIMFYSSSFVSIFSILILIGMKETIKSPQKLSWSLLKISPQDLFEPRVISPCIVMLLTIFPFGIVLTIIPDYSDYLGIANRGVFFSIFTFVSLIVRLIAGRVSDRFGRTIVLKASSLVLSLAMLAIGFSKTPTQFLAAAVLLGIATGMTAPSIFAWTIDLSHGNHRGKAMSSLYISLEIGIGLGALFSAWLYGNKPTMFVFVFGFGAVLAILSFIYLQFSAMKIPKHQ